MTNRIKEFRRARGWSMQKLADSIGTTKSQIDKLEKGGRRLTVDWMVRLAKGLGCDPRELMFPVDQGRVLDFIHPLAPTATPVPAPTVITAPPEAGPVLVPVRGTIRCGTFGDFSFDDNVIDALPRPYFLTQARDAYAVYVTGTAMAPMYRPRQVVFVNPHKLPIAGNGVVFIDKAGVAGIRELVRQNDTEVVVRTYHPTPQDVTIPQDRILALHAVVGASEP